MLAFLIFLPLNLSINELSGNVPTLLPSGQFKQHILHDACANFVVPWNHIGPQRGGFLQADTPLEFFFGFNVLQDAMSGLLAVSERTWALSKQTIGSHLLLSVGLPPFFWPNMGLLMAEDAITPFLLSSKTPLVVAHEASIRATRLHILPARFEPGPSKQEVRHVGPLPRGATMFRVFNRKTFRIVTQYTGF